MKHVTLSNGVKMPIIGYGVYQISKQDCTRCVLDALEVGYRHIDTAQAYNNEEEVGLAVQQSGIPREEVFLTTKVWLNKFNQEDCKLSVEQSLQKLRTDYIDLVLLHQPFGDVYGAWRGLEQLYAEGKVRAIGISNFLPDKAVEFCLFNNIKPMVNQIEIHPLHQQNEAVQWNEKYGLKVEAWAPFGEGRNNMFSNPHIQQIGDKYGKTVAQVILRWLIQRGITVLPKSVHKDRMQQNFDVFDFELSPQDMTAMAALDTKQSAFFSHRDPAIVEWFAQMAK